MSELTIVFSDRAKSRLENLTDYLFEQTQSPEFVLAYIDSLESYLTEILNLFPESGTLMLEFGEDIRRIVFKEFSFLYRIKPDQIEILTVYRENLP